MINFPSRWLQWLNKRPNQYETKDFFKATTRDLKKRQSEYSQSLLERLKPGSSCPEESKSLKSKGSVNSNLNYWFDHR